LVPGTIADTDHDNTQGISGGLDDGILGFLDLVDLTIGNDQENVVVLGILNDADGLLDNGGEVGGARQTQQRCELNVSL